MTGDNGSGNNTLSPHVVWATVVILLGLLGTVAFIVTRNLEPSNYLSLVGSIVAPTLGIAYAIIQNGKMVAKVDKIEKQTNGALTQQIQSVKHEVTKAVDELRAVRTENEDSGKGSDAD
jgi:hypothetical protein